MSGDEYKLTVPAAKPKPVADYLKLQKRFAGVDEQQTEELQATVEKEYARLMKKRVGDVRLSIAR